MNVPCGWFEDDECVLPRTANYPLNNNPLTHYLSRWRMRTPPHCVASSTTKRPALRSFSSSFTTLDGTRWEDIQHIIVCMYYNAFSLAKFQMFHTCNVKLSNHFNHHKLELVDTMALRRCLTWSLTRRTRRTRNTRCTRRTRRHRRY